MSLRFSTDCVLNKHSISLFFKIKINFKKNQQYSSKLFKTVQYKNQQKNRFQKVLENSK